MESSIYIQHLASGQQYAYLATRQFEGSSTIKTVIILLTLQKLKDERISPYRRLPILLQHLSIGSGMLNWTRKRSLTIKGHIKYIARYSDCVATNVLIDFVGGKATINKELARRGLLTRLEMESLQFTDKEVTMPHVSTTTAHDIAKVFVLLFDACGVRRYQRLIRSSFKRIDQPWCEDIFDLDSLGPHRVWLKTGSIYEIGPRQDCVMNVVGIVELSGVLFAFSSLNRVSFQRPASQADIYEAKKLAMQELTHQLKVINRQCQGSNIIPSEELLSG
jgi:hypothetical protein